MESLPAGTVLLSPLDQLAERMCMTVFFVFKTPDPDRAVQSLQAGLRRLNRYLQYLRGHVVLVSRGRLAVRLAATDEEVKLEAMPANSAEILSMSFEQLQAEKAPLHRFPPSLCPRPLFVPFDEDSAAPVLALNYACLDGGLVVGVSPQHNVLDGGGVVAIIRLWAHFARTDSNEVDEFSAPSPSELGFRRDLLRGRQSDEGRIREAKGREAYFQELLEKHPEYALRSARGAGVVYGAAGEAASKIFSFDADKLVMVKNTLEQQNPPPDRSMRLTANRVLSAILWSAITRARATRRGAKFAAASVLGFPVDVRRHVGMLGNRQPFLGNTVCLGVAKAPLDDLVQAGPSGDDGLRGLVSLVDAVAGAMMRITPEGVEEVMDMVEGAPDAGAFVPAWDNVGGHDVTMTSWANLGLYEADFGGAVGKPKFVRVPEGRADGIVIVLPLKEEERVEGTGGCIEVVVILNTEDLAALEKDPTLTSCLVSEA